MNRDVVCQLTPLRAGRGNPSSHPTPCTDHPSSSIVWSDNQGARLAMDINQGRCAQGFS